MERFWRTFSFFYNLTKIILSVWSQTVTWIITNLFCFILSTAMGTVRGMEGGSEGCRKYEKQVPPGRWGHLLTLDFLKKKKKKKGLFSSSKSIFDLKNWFPAPENLWFDILYVIFIIDSCIFSLLINTIFFGLTKNRRQNRSSATGLLRQQRHNLVPGYTHTFRGLRGLSCIQEIAMITPISKNLTGIQRICKLEFGKLLWNGL